MSVVEKVRLSFYIAHTRPGDLDMILAAPDLTSFSLLGFDTIALKGQDNVGAGTADASRCIFDDDAATSIFLEPAPRVGSFRPWTFLSELDGATVEGTWTLTVEDFNPGNGNLGTLEAASLFLTVDGVETRYETTGLPAAIPDTSGLLSVSFEVGEPAPPVPASLYPFTVQITPLIRPDPGFVDEEDIITVTQFADLDVSHPWKGYKTAKVTLSMEDVAVEDLQPYAFALRVLYEDREEPVFWGQSNIVDDYENGLCHLEAQDASLRMMHHYLRRGDDLLNDVPEEDKGTINADNTGIEGCIDAAQNIASQDLRNDPSLGCIASPTRVSTPRVAPIVVERGQECWQVVSDIGQAELGPDVDMETPDDFENYTELATYDPDTMGTDRTSATPDSPGAGEVVLSYGLIGDNMLGPTVNPQHPTTHAHVLSEDARYRVTAAATVAANDTGGFIDWVRTGFQVDSTEDLDVLTEVAQARVRAYGVPPKHTTVALRPDIAITHNYGRPTFTAPVGTRTPTFYLGDAVTVRAERGFRSFSQAMRVKGVHLTWPGWQGPALTLLELIPVVGGDIDDEDT